MKLRDFIDRHPVFTIDELDRFLTEKGSLNRNTRNSLLSYYRQQGRIVSVRRGLYAVVPVGASPESSPVDPFLLAGKITPDAVLAYHTALEYHGNAYSVFNRFHYISNRYSVPTRFQNYEFRSVLHPCSLRKKARTEFGVQETERSGIHIRVTGYERTLVDVLDRPDLSGSWEEIWRSLESIEFFDLDQVVAYALLLENATTAAKVGFFLEQHREMLMVDDGHLEALHDLRPHQPHYLKRSKRRNGSLVSKWNLVVPREVLERSWAEVQ